MFIELCLNIVADEGYFANEDKGAYGPYKQSDRANIYKTVIKHLIEEGKAYPDFCSAEDLQKIREYQEANKILPGYYGEYARDRKLTVDEQIEKIKAGTPWVIRYKSMGDHEKKIKFKDAIRGEIELQDNDQDVVIMKNDGLPTYHFAHVVDDHFMRTTAVTRGEEWIPSTPIHLQLFRELGWKAPKYAHLPVIMKLDNGNKRKLSKRKDPEAAVSYFLQAGYPARGLLVYLMSIANSNFEEWTITNKSFDASKFTFSFKKMSLDGALFDEDKLSYFSKEVIASTPKEELIKNVKSWASKNNESLLEKINDDEEYLLRILSIGKDSPNPRKDYAKYSDIESKTWFFFDEDFSKHGDLPFDEKYDKAFLKSFLEEVAEKQLYNTNESEWWNGVKELASANGFAISNKDYKANPEAFKGNIGAAAEIIRIAITGQKDAPNLHEVIDILGEERVKARLKNAI